MLRSLSLISSRSWPRATGNLSAILPRTAKTCVLTYSLLPLTVLFMAIGGVGTTEYAFGVPCSERYGTNRWGYTEKTKRNTLSELLLGESWVRVLAEAGRKALTPRDKIAQTCGHLTQIWLEMYLAPERFVSPPLIIWRGDIRFFRI